MPFSQAQLVSILGEPVEAKTVVVSSATDKGVGAPVVRLTFACNCVALRAPTSDNIHVANIEFCSSEHENSLT